MEMSDCGELGMRVKLVGLANKVRCAVLAKYEGSKPVAKAEESVVYTPNQWHCVDTTGHPKVVWIKDNDSRTIIDRSLTGLLRGIKEHERGQTPESKKVFDFYLDGAKTLVRYMLDKDGVPFLLDGYTDEMRAMLTHLVGIVVREDQELDRLDLVLSLGQILKGDVISEVEFGNGKIVSVSDPCVVISTNDGTCVVTTDSRTINDPLKILFRSRPGRRVCPDLGVLGCYDLGASKEKVRWMGYFYEIERTKEDGEVETRYGMEGEDLVNPKMKYEDGIDEAFIESYVPPEPTHEPCIWDPYGLSSVRRPCPEWPEDGHPARRIMEGGNLKK
jgi:dimeric dUTPase (all-alpha-NTP-PPase superfamily)